MHRNPPSFDNIWRVYLTPIEECRAVRRPPAGNPEFFPILTVVTQLLALQGEELDSLKRRGVADTDQLSVGF